MSVRREYFVIVDGVVIFKGSYKAALDVSLALEHILVRCSGIKFDYSVSFRPSFDDE